MNKLICVLLPSFNLTGISQIMQNYLFNFDVELKERIYVFATGNSDSIVAKEFISHGFEVFFLPSKKKNFLSYLKCLYKAIKKYNFSTIHINANSCTCIFEVAVSKIAKVKNTIVHSHNSTGKHKLVNFFLRLLLNLLNIKKIACSEKAGIWMFGRFSHFVILNNGVDYNRFRFSLFNRLKIRNELNLKDEDILIGHIGRFNEQKNQKYILKVFGELLLSYPNSYLVLIGTGPSFNEIFDVIKKSNFSNKVFLIGETAHPENYYSALDIFVFPSKFEGLPLTLIEAQINSLPCIISNNITDEAIISNLVYKLPINEANVAIWSKLILKIGLRNSNLKLNNLSHSFDIKKCVKTLEDIYKMS